MEFSFYSFSNWFHIGSKFWRLLKGIFSGTISDIQKVAKIAMDPFKKSYFSDDEKGSVEMPMTIEKMPITVEKLLMMLVEKIPMMSEMTSRIVVRIPHANMVSDLLRTLTSELLLETYPSEKPPPSDLGSRNISACWHFKILNRCLKLQSHKIGLFKLKMSSK